MVSLRTRVRICSSRCAPRGLQRICCFLTMRLLMTWFDRGFDERGGDGLAGESAFPVVGDGRGVGGEVAPELADRLGQFARLDADVGEIGGEVVDGLPGTEDVAVPEEPLHPLQLLGDIGGPFGWAAQT